MTERVTVGNLRVAPVLYDFVNNEALPGTDIDPDTFWSGVDKVVADLSSVSGMIRGSAHLSHCYIDGANIAGFVKVADAMLAFGAV